MSDENSEEMTCFDRIVYHFQNSSLLIFPQNSTIRQWCQLCVQSEDDDDESMKNRQSAQDKLVDAGGDGGPSEADPDNKPMGDQLASPTNNAAEDIGMQAPGANSASKPNMHASIT